MTAAPRLGLTPSAVALYAQAIANVETNARWYERDAATYRDEGHLDVAAGFQALAAEFRARALHLRLFVVDHAEVAS